MGPNVERIRSGSTRVIRGHMPLEVRRELMAAVKAMLSLDEDNHQRHAGDDDVCYEVRKAREAVAKALGHNA